MLSKFIQFSKTTEFCFIPGTSLANFRAYIMEENSVKDKITQLRKEVENFAKDFPMPGFDKT